MTDTALVWFRADLRVHDNATLRAGAAADRTVCLYVFDPRAFDGDGGMFGLPKTGAHRARFLRESVSDLREQLRERGGELLVRTGRPEAVVPTMTETVGADVVHCQTKPATEELQVENAVKKRLPETVPLDRHWTHTLYHINDLPRAVGEIEDTFTPFKDRTEATTEVREPLAPPSTLTPPDADRSPGRIPVLEDLGFDPDAAAADDRGVLAFDGGETAGRERVNQYVWAGDHLRNYRETRNGLLGADYSSKVSPWLAHGCLSPRWLKTEVDRYERERVANKDTYWLVFELTWRDFFQFQLIKHGARFFIATGIRDVDREWSGGDGRFRRWAEGDTGVPFIDANMRELAATGYMSNRGRQNVASFLTDWLQVDWRKGAAHFEAQLIDYDVASNWGNWAYQAGVGNDARDRFFNVLSQADRYDPTGAYVRHWLPTLADLPGDAVHAPWRLTDDQQALYDVHLGIDYPRPVIDIEARLGTLQRER